MRILMVEDDVAVAGFVRQGLREASYAVDWASDGVEGLHLASTEDYDAIVLDLMLPRMDGLTLLRNLRLRKTDTPIICLTARDGVNDRVEGLNAGADDYLAKPFSFAELQARINALLRRGHRLTNNPIVVGDLSVDVLSRVVQRGSQRIDLSPREFALLEYLARNAGNILSRTMLIEHVWDMNQDPLTNVVDVHVNRLRKKVDHGFNEPLIHTIRGVGYVLRRE
jgi:two-component system OmpR family response regulator